MLNFLLQSKFARDVLWNVGSLGILAISGIALNIVIGRFYGAEALGVFNQVFALYLFLSQVAVFGIYFSVLKYVAQFSENSFKCNAIITSGIVVTTLIAGIVTIITILLSGWIGEILESPKVSKGWLYVLPGFWCYAVNKVLMAVLNGYRDMKTFALVQTMRYSLMVIMLIGCVIMRVPSNALPLAISWPEIILLIFLLKYTLKFYTPVSFKKWEGWALKHLSFGARSVLSGTMGSLNTRVDVLMLGYFCSDQVVGIYSMAALIVEGFIMLSLVIRNNLNPILAKLIAKGQINKLKETIKVGLKTFYIILGSLGIIAIIIYPLFIKIFVGNRDFMASWIPFVILMTGFILCSGYLPFNMILVQAGYPGLHTLLKSAIIFSNIVLNAMLIPIAGIHGAACATAIVFILSVIYLKIFVRKVLRIQI